MPSEDSQFKKGRTKSAGRKKGSRNKLTHAHIKLLSAAHDEHGKQVIDKIAETKPEALLKAWGSLIPKDLDVKHSGDVTVNVVDYSDDDKDDD